MISLKSVAMADVLKMSGVRSQKQEIYFHILCSNNMATEANTTTTEVQKLQLRGETSVNYEKEKVCR